MIRRLTLAVGLLLLAADSTSLPAQDRDRSQQPAAPGAAQVAPQGPPPPGRRFGRPPEWGPRHRPGPGPGPGGQFPPGGGPPEGMRPRWGGGPMPPFLFELAEKSPEEQERILQSHPRFSRLPPEAQQHIRERLKRISAMTPEERQQLRERFEIFHHLSPEARDKIREQVFPAWSHVAPERRRALMQEFRAMRGMTPEEREQRFAQDSFTKQFSAEEQQLLRQLLSLAVP